MYHGRRFNLDGAFEYMPEFEDADDFPRPCDNLHKFPLEKWGPLLFVGLNPEFQFSKVIDKMKERIGFLPLDEFSLDTSIRLKASCLIEIKSLSDLYFTS